MGRVAARWPELTGGPTTAELVARIAAAWRPPPTDRLATWCERWVRLPPELTATPGPLRFDRAPYLRGVIDLADDPQVETIALQWGAQLGKTTALLLLLAGVAVLDPSPALLAAPNRDALIELRDKFYRLAEATPPVAALLPPAHRRNNRAIDFGRAQCYLGYAGSAQRLSAKSCKRVLCTEIDRWVKSTHEGAAPQLAAERVKSFFRYLVVYESTPSDETSQIASLYERSDRRTFQVPCPRCGGFQELRFFPHADGPRAGRGGVRGLQDAAGAWLPADQVRREAYYSCEHCGGRIESHDKAAAVRAGVWVPAGQTVGRDGRLQGTPERSPRHAGFRLSSLAADSISFGRAAEEYLLSRDNEARLQSFWNNWLGLTWRRAIKRPRWERIGRRLAGAHRRGTAPGAAIFLTAGIDNQADAAYWVVRAWGEGSTSWLVDWGKVTQRVDETGALVPESDLEQLHDLIFARAFPLTGENAAGQTALRVRLACLDFQGSRSYAVVAWANRQRQRYGDRLRTIAGDSRLPAGQWFTQSRVERSRTGKRYAGGLERWALNVDAYKAGLVERFDLALDAPGAFFLHADCLAVGQDYLRQLCNEARQVQRTAAGREAVRWLIVDDAVGNHYLDCEVYARAAADMVTGLDWANLTTRAKQAAKPPKDKRAAAADGPTAPPAYHGRPRR